ncbi:MAG: hypothetical protein JW943_03205 [Deltaproteobacteria bacterium]|nr:hypothetical protein [Deltaproteobacteria bacterium]
MKKVSWVGVIMLTGILFAATATAPAYAFEIGARAFVWFPQYKGDMKIDSDNLAGSAINAVDDLGLGNEIYPEVEVYGGIGKHHLSLMYTSMDHSGLKNVTKNIIFNGVNYAAGSVINTDLKSKMLDLEYQYDLINLENLLAGFSIGLIGKVKYLDCEAQLIAPTVGESKDTLQYFIPMVGAGAHIGLLANLLEARAKVTGMGYGGDNMIYEGLAEISVTPFPFLDIHGGYRHLKMKVDRKSFFMDSQFSGPYLGLSVGF